MQKREFISHTNGQPAMTRSVSSSGHPDRGIPPGRWDRTPATFLSACLAHKAQQHDPRSPWSILTHPEPRGTLDRARPRKAFPDARPKKAATIFEPHREYHARSPVHSTPITNVMMALISWRFHCLEIFGRLLGPEIVIDGFDGCRAATTLLGKLRACNSCVAPRGMPQRLQIRQKGTRLFRMARLRGQGRGAESQPLNMGCSDWQARRVQLEALLTKASSV